MEKEISVDLIGYINNTTTVFSDLTQKIEESGIEDEARLALREIKVGAVPQRPYLGSCVQAG